MSKPARPSHRDTPPLAPPKPPEQLATAMRNALRESAEHTNRKENGRDDNGSTTQETANDFLDAAAHLLGRVLRTDCETRAAALDLLTVDALMTRALELAAADPVLMETFPERAMQRIAAIGEADKKQRGGEKSARQKKFSESNDNRADDE